MVGDVTFILLHGGWGGERGASSKDMKGVVNFAWCVFHVCPSARL